MSDGAGESIAAIVRQALSARSPMTECDLLLLGALYAFSEPAGPRWPCA